MFYKHVPNYILDMVELDNIGDEEDGYKLYIDDGEFIWTSNFITFYLDINQWMLLNPELKKNYEYKVSNQYFSCEVVMCIKNIYSNQPTLSNIDFDVNMEGDVENFSIYPKCNLKYAMTKDEIIKKFGDVYEEE